MIIDQTKRLKVNQKNPKRTVCERKVLTYLALANRYSYSLSINYNLLYLLKLQICMENQKDRNLDNTYEMGNK
jgi:hypothetical protein